MSVTPIRPDRARELVITRQITYEIRIPFERFKATPAVDLHEMTIVNDSGPQTFIEEQQA